MPEISKLISKLIEVESIKQGSLQLNYNGKHFSFCLTYKDKKMFTVVKEGSWNLHAKTFNLVVDTIMNELNWIIVVHNKQQVVIENTEALVKQH